MAYLVISPSQNSCTMYVAGLMSYSNYTEVYISCNGQNSPNLTYGGTGKVSSKSWTVYSLSSGTQYWASYRIRTSAGSSDSDGSYFTTTRPSAPPPVNVGGVGSVYVSNGGSLGSINVSWSYATNAESYRVEVYNYYTGAYLGYSTTSYTNTSIYNLPYDTYIQVKVYGVRSGSSNGNPSYGYLMTTGAIKVGAVGYVNVSNGDSLGKIHINWGSATNASQYRVEIYNSNTGRLITYEHNSFTSSTMYNIPEDTYIQVKVYGIRSGSDNGSPAYGYLLTNGRNIGGVGAVSVSNGNTAGKIHISWSSATNASQYRIEIYNYYTGALITSEHNSYTSSTMYNIPEGVYIQVKVYGIRSGYNNGTPSYAYLTTTSYPVGGVGNVNVQPSSTSGVLNVSWSYATNATGYRIEVYHNATDAYIAGYNTTSTSYTVTGLNENVSYKIKVYGTKSGATNGNPSYGYGSTASFAPAQLTGLRVTTGTASGGIHINWNTATNATGYRWEIYRGDTTNNSYYVTGGNTTNTYVDHLGLAEYTLYTVKVYATRSGYTNGGYQTATVTTRDSSPPVVTITMSDGEGRMYIAFNATDSQSGMRTVDTFYTEISNENGTTYGQGSYTTNKYKTFTVDANGREFVHNSYYYMKVVAYDMSGNNNSTYVRVQFKKARPDSWAWHTVKVAGQPILLTAQEWNSFCIKINQFRQYKSLSNYSFSTATKGEIITASIINQAINAISPMSPSTKPPAIATAGKTEITASFLNTLSSSLNSL